MPFVMPEIVVHKILKDGIRDLRQNRPAFDDLFSQMTQDELGNEYGQTYVDSIWDWFTTTKLPVVQAWSLNAQKIPCISVHLANETEDEQKAALSDFAGNFDGEQETNTGVFTVMVDIGIHANRAGDQVLWLYYIVSYILFKNKLKAHRLGLKLHTYSASDYNKDASKMTENIWTRWIRFRCTTENFWSGQAFGMPEALSLDPSVGNPPAYDIATSLDVDIDSVDPTANAGLRAGRVGDEGDEEDMNI